MFSGDYQGKILARSVTAETLAPEATLDAHRGWVRALAVSPDGRLLASCGNDNLVKLWSTTDLSLVRSLVGHEHHVYSVAFHPGGRHLVSADLHGSVRQWAVADGTQTRSLDCSVLFRYDPTFRADHGGVAA